MFFREKEKFIYIILLILYLALLLQMTLIGRSYTDPLSAVFTGWLPFRRYDGTWNIDAIYNIFLFAPVIFFMNGIYPFVLHKDWKYRTLIGSFLISAFIEINQLIFSIGTFQISDLVYNSLSGIIGGELFIWFQKTVTSKQLLLKWKMIMDKKWFRKYKKYINKGKIDKAKRLLLNKIPKNKIVYKYYRGLNRDWNNITENKVWISNAKKFNDPFDCAFLYNCRSKDRYDFETKSKLAFAEMKKQRKQDKVSKDIQESVFISCFSDKYDSMLMWSHYSDEHKGICVGYNLYELIDKYNCFPVIYSNKMPQRKFIKTNDQNMLYETILTKSKDWKYETEWRIIKIDIDRKGEDGTTIELAKPVSIYLGKRIDDAKKHNHEEYEEKKKEKNDVNKKEIFSSDQSRIDISKIIDYVNKEGIKLYDFELSRKSFKLERRSIKT